MADQFGQAPLVSPLAQYFKTCAVATRPLLRAPHNLGLVRTLHHSLAGARVLSLSSVGRQGPFMMADDSTGAALLFAAAQDNLLDIVAEENSVPRPVEAGKASSTTIETETFGINV